MVKAVDGVSFSIDEGESVGLVGESGSGKTVTALTILGIVQKPGRIVSGQILYRGQNILQLNQEESRKIRGRKIGMVFQDPNSSLDPLYSVGDQLMEVVRVHSKLTKEEARKKALSLLELVKISEPEARLRAYPFELSGGMKQRVAIARALAGEPEVLIADEPTTNLDVTIQAQVLELLRGLQKELGMTLILITHDMGIIAEMTTRIVVLYAGRVAEVASTKDLYKVPRHPYTYALLKAVPRIDARKQLVPIAGNIPNLITPPTGCRYHPRCPYATQECTDVIPPLEAAGEGRLVSCHHWKELATKKELTFA
ncbi:MAG TPA: ABC transporter ATP-binding protein [Nitrososphaerales archaeon]|nr:ABC transporter ATP-binding protein [Nitrososphaerales archaeon]